LNAVEIEEAISNLAEQAFDAASFPYTFLDAFGNKATTIKRLQSGSTNTSDIEGGVLQRSNIHLAVCAEGEVTNRLNALKASLTTSKAKLILVTDGIGLEAEDFTSGETVWLTQLEIAKLFQTTRQNVSLYAKNIFDEAELLLNSVVKESLTVQTDGRRYPRRITTFKRT